MRCALDPTRQLLRAAVQGLVAGGVLAVLSVSFDSHSPWSAFYVGALAAPFAVVESRLCHGRLLGNVFVAAGAGWIVALVAVACAHAQATYASGVLVFGDLHGGARALGAEADRLARLPPGDLALFGLPNYLYDLVAASGIALAVAATNLGRPLATRHYGIDPVGADVGPYSGVPYVSRAEIIGGMIGIYLAALPVAALITSVLAALPEFDLRITCFTPVFAILVAINSVPGLLAFGCGRFLAAHAFGGEAERDS